jgi:DNA-binding transcriptional ArsR family regulator
MNAKRAIRDRDTDEEEAILGALVDRGEEGMTVLELRASVDEDIDAIESGLTELKQDGLIDVEREDGSTVIKPDESVMPEDDAGEEQSILDAIRDRLPF